MALRADLFICFACLLQNLFCSDYTPTHAQRDSVCLCLGGREGESAGQRWWWHGIHTHDTQRQGDLLYWYCSPAMRSGDMYVVDPTHLSVSQ